MSALATMLPVFSTNNIAPGAAPAASEATVIKDAVVAVVAFP